MKGFALTLLLSGLVSVASAQMKDRIAAAPVRVSNGGTPVSADELTRQMANRLHLNEAQYIRLKAANQIKLARTDEIQWQYKQDPSTLQAKLQELDAQYEAECRRILTPSQISLMHAEQSQPVLPKTEPAGNGLG
ncbi:hypothetical protein EJV47_23085 [Hymenobacter gummosus]|uniref:Uncharacterized protein n=2 Tax=Hymenobacter gummosus TaxID=1776032 RepID=A0A3S0JB26_9BACT|nr:hypothetical protein EJV47_23085 [Hymenobacter gummosus]